MPLLRKRYRRSLLFLLTVLFYVSIPAQVFALECASERSDVRSLDDNWVWSYQPEPKVRVGKRRLVCRNGRSGSVIDREDFPGRFIVLDDNPKNTSLERDNLCSALFFFCHLEGALRTSSTDDLSTLANNDPIRNAASSVGTIETSNEEDRRKGHSSICSGVLISPSYALTRCIVHDRDRAEIKFVDYPLDPTTLKAVYPVEEAGKQDKKLYAVARLQRPADPYFHPAKLLARMPLSGEEIIVIGMNKGRIRRNCKILDVMQPDLTFKYEPFPSIRYSCGEMDKVWGDEDVLFSKSGFLIGLEPSAHPGGKEGQWAIPVSSILSSDEFVRANSSVMDDRQAASIAQLPQNVTKDKPLPSENELSIMLAGDSTLDWKTLKTINLNGESFAIKRYDPEGRKISLLGPEGHLPFGLNSVEAATRKLTFWYEKNTLSAFAQPYKSSFAIIVAIDDYDRKLDPQKRGPTGYRTLAHMIDNAQELKDTLLTLGFPAQNIRTYFNGEATSANITHALQDFWAGGDSENAGRVFFYFGGHGDGKEGSGYLVTYDFDPRRPTSTSFLMSDFVGHHFPNIRAHHLMVAVDACSSGLAVPGARSLGDRLPKEFATLAQIQASVEQPARNLLVAGTSDEPAVENAGGIFTKALIRGLKGEADLRKNGVISFDELGFFVKGEVEAEARAMGVHQKPVPFKATQFGDGEVVFTLPRRVE